MSRKFSTLALVRQLWVAADKLRGSMEPSDYKHVTLGVMFLNYISDAFEVKSEELLADVVDCMTALSGQLFYLTQIPASLWLLARNKNPGNGRSDRQGEGLFIDARNLWHMVNVV